MPTGIESLDSVIEGGMPSGSMVLLLSDIGGGSTEFVYSSILNLSLMSERASGKGSVPSSIRYLTFTRMKEDVTQEMTLSFHADLVQGLPDIRFEDLSEKYFDASVVPVEWYSRGNLMDRLQHGTTRTNILADLADRLNKGQHGSLIVFDSLTDMATQYSNTPHWTELTGFLRGLQRVAKEWRSTLYILLTRGVLPPSQEREISEIADAVLLFRWEESTGSRRQRVMYFEKFRGLMPHLEEKDMVKFAVRISVGGGFEVSNIRVII
jgi:KaiC/GvpD/RAD55 family RecA-like ATPase